MRGSKQGREVEVQINESENASLAQEKRTHQHFSVTASSYYDDWQFQCNHRSVTEGGPSLEPGRHPYLNLAFDPAHNLFRRDGFRCQVASRPGPPRQAHDRAAIAEWLPGFGETSSVFRSPQHSPSVRCLRAL